VIARRLLLAALLLVLAPGAFAATLDEKLDEGWRVQRRWTTLAANGSFVYAFSLKTWNGAGRLKESITREIRLSNRGTTHDWTVLSATKDGKDDTEAARAEERKRAAEPETKRKDDLPSPFDPRFRNRYVFAEAPENGGGGELSFRPGAPFENALRGRAFFDGGGGLRRVEFTLDRRPAFTKRLDFTVLIAENGYPETVDTSGEISLVVWKRKFESRLVVREIRPGGKESP